MGLLSIFQRNKQPSAQAPKGRGGKSAARQPPLANTRNAPDAADAMREVRARARRRLMGATVLLLVGVIGFPLLFETQPRPVPVDLPIEIPSRNAPGTVDAGAHAGARHLASAAPLAPSGPVPESVSYDNRSSAPQAASLPTPTPASAAYIAPSMGGPKPAKAAKADEPAARPAAEPPASPRMAAPDARPAPAAEAKPSPAAILADAGADSPPEAASSGRFVIQVGAFLEDAKVRATRAKVDKLGMKTYTQPVQTPGGKRIRVRVGPVATRAEADKLASRLKADGLPAVVLSL